MTRKNSTQPKSAADSLLPGDGAFGYPKGKLRTFTFNGDTFRNGHRPVIFQQYPT